MDFGKKMKGLSRKIPVQRGERVITKLAGTELESRWHDIAEAHSIAVRKSKELEEACGILNAKAVLFWSDVKHSSEFAESAEDRGKTLGIRSDKDDNLVLVEYTEKTPNVQDTMRRLFGLSEEENDDESR